MVIERLSIPGLIVIQPRKIGDHRGFLAEIFRQDLLNGAAGPVNFVQWNHSYSAAVGTIRGLHFQVPPHAQGKLVRVVRGAILDVAVDLRVGSPTFGQHEATVLSAENLRQLWVPAGFAHGFCTIEPDTEVTYHLDAYYSPAAEAGIAFDDPALGIAWPVPAADMTLSDKDGRNPRLAELPAYFSYPAG